MKIVITEEKIEIYGTDDVQFSREHLGTCRDASRVALAFAAKRISDEQHKDATGDWNNGTVVIAD